MSIDSKCDRDTPLEPSYNEASLHRELQSQITRTSITYPEYVAIDETVKHARRGLYVSVSRQKRTNKIIRALTFPSIQLGVMSGSVLAMASLYYLRRYKTAGVRATYVVTVGLLGGVAGMVSSGSITYKRYAKDLDEADVDRYVVP